MHFEKIAAMWMNTIEESACRPAEHRFLSLSPSPVSWANWQSFGIKPSKLNMQVPSFCKIWQDKMSLKPVTLLTLKINYTANLKSIFHNTRSIQVIPKEPTWLFTKSKRVWHPIICIASCRVWSSRVCIMLSKLLANSVL